MPKQKQKGFTLIELLIVIVILGILATIGLASFASSQMKSRDARRKANLNQVAGSLEIYFNDMSKYPSASAVGQIMGCGAGAVGT
jgi:prepilin-type N-terminal cleavage/methylation domain-containing protein